MADFTSARLISAQPGGEPTIEIQRDSAPDSVVVVSAPLVAQLRRYVEEHDKPQVVVDELDWSLLRGFAAYIQRVTPQEPTTFRLIDGAVLDGTLAWVDGRDVIVLPGPPYDWRASPFEALRIPADIVSEIGTDRAAVIGRAVRSIVRRNILIPVALVAVGVLGNGSAEVSNPGFIGGVAFAAAGAILSVQAPTVATSPGGPPYPALSPSNLADAVQAYALYRSTPPPDMRAAARLRDVTVHVIAPKQPSRLRAWRAPRFRARLGIAAPYTFRPETTFEHFQSRIAGGSGTTENVELAHAAPWDVDAAVRIFRGIILGTRLVYNATPDVDEGAEYFRGHTMHPYVELSIERGLAQSARFVRSLYFSISGGPAFENAAVEHVVSYRPVVDVENPFEDAPSRFGWSRIGGAASGTVGFTLSRYANLSVTYTHWFFQPKAVPARDDRLTVGDETITLHALAEYDVEPRRGTIRFGINLTL